jgi:hypothetical protein
MGLFFHAQAIGYQALGRMQSHFFKNYSCFQKKGIDWKKNCIWCSPFVAQFQMARQSGVPNLDFPKPDFSSTNDRIIFRFTG